MTRSICRPHGRRSALVLVAALLSGACVSQKEYQDAVDLAKHYQTQLLDSEQYQKSLEGEKARLEKELALARVQAGEAGFSEEFEAQLDELQQRIEGLGRAPKDIEIFDFGDRGYLVMVQDAVLFDSGSAEVSPDGRGKLIQLAREIQSRPHGRVLVRGHTDSDPVAKPETKRRFPHGNLQLSAARAIEVAAVLTAQGGVPKDDVVVMGFGPSEPLKPNDSPENKRLNRRVEIFVTPPER